MNNLLNLPGYDASAHFKTKLFFHHMPAITYFQLHIFIQILNYPIMLFHSERALHFFVFGKTKARGNNIC